MAKKKIQKIELQSFDDVDFNKSPDLEAAKIIAEQITPTKETPKVEEKVVPPIAKEKAPPKEKKVTQEPKAPPAPAPVAAKPKKAKAAPLEKRTARGTLPPGDKKRASFNIDKDLHRALKDYCYFNDIQMVEYVFEELVRKDLSKRGYYPPKKRK